ncbi:MAG: molybdenum cofactor guanylyltransferase [Nitrospirae bacterium]|nr:MAG: molybdenum cofactor guanylyltransferase [Nitrospirota bacterium]
MTGLIIAGGKSRRLGIDKRFLDLGGRTCIQRVLDAYRGIFDEILVVADAVEPFQSLGLRVVVDLIPGRAALGGLYTGLHYAASERVFAAAADMPWIAPAAIRIVLDQSLAGDIVIPDLDGKLQPMHAVYAKACLPFLRTLVEAGTLKVQELCNCPELRVRRIPRSAFTAADPGLRSFFNINTPDDLAQAKKWISE